jgi:predicted enzyme related to lactoylglutathione lyase
MLYLFIAKQNKMGKAVGIGGIFMKYNDEKAMKAWFETALGLTPNDYGVLFAFNGVPDSKRGFLQLGTFAATTNYFGNPAQQYMINFRVTDLVALEKHLRELGTVICDTIETYDFGSFLHIEDPEGNRIELWEPIDSDSESKEVFVDMR